MGASWRRGEPPGPAPVHRLRAEGRLVVRRWPLAASQLVEPEAPPVSGMNGEVRPTARQGGRFDLSPVVARASGGPPLHEVDLFAAYGSVGIEHRACVCGGLVHANPQSPAVGVQAHNYSPRHKAWRLWREDN